MRMTRRGHNIAEGSVLLALPFLLGTQRTETALMTRVACKKHLARVFEFGLKNGAASLFRY